MLAGRPVILGSSMPMAELAEKTGCGVVLENVNADEVSAAIAKIRADYAAFQKRVLSVDMDQFSVERMIASYKAIYDEIS